MTLEMELPQHLDIQTFTDYLMNNLNNRSNHYFLAVYTQIAGRIPMSGTAKILTDISEEVFYSSLKTLMESDHASTIPHRFYIAELYYAAVGLGKLKFNLEKNEGILSHSMLDNAWIRLFSTSTTPINFVTSGYIAATFGLVFGKPLHSYRVSEKKSIACGESFSIFKIQRAEDVIKTLLSVN